MRVRRIWLAGLAVGLAAAAGGIAWQVVMPRPGLWLRDQGVWLGQVSPSDGAVVQWWGPDHDLRVTGRRGWLVEEVSGSVTNLSGATPAPSHSLRREGRLLPWGNFALNLPALRGWNHVLVQARRGTDAFTWSGRVALGEVFLVAGQSNAAGWSDLLNACRSEDVRLGILRADGRLEWRNADDPQTPFGRGSPWPTVGEALVEARGLPVGFLNVAEGGTSIKDWEKGGRLFRRLVDTLRAAGPNGVRAILWAQGESDNDMGGEEYAERLESLIHSVNRAAGRDVIWVVATSSYVNFSPQSGVREAQQSVVSRGLAAAGPDTDKLGREFRESDGVHFSREGTKALAGLWVEALQEHLGR